MISTLTYCLALFALALVGLVSAWRGIQLSWADDTGTEAAHQTRIEAEHHETTVTNLYDQQGKQ